jgi:hypothetical protein
MSKTNLELLALETIDFEKEKNIYWNNFITIGMVKVLWYWESYGKIRKKGDGGKEVGRDSPFTLELGLFNKGITFVFITMKIQYITSYLKSKSKNHGPKKVLQ